MNKFIHHFIIVFMDTRFLTDNFHLKNPERYAEFDPHLQLLNVQEYIYHFPLLNHFPTQTPNVYTLSGAYKTGKTTLLKQWIEKLLAQGIKPESIAFLNGELIENYHVLQRFLQKQITSMPRETLIYIVVDEVTTVRDWLKAIKACIEEKLFDQVIVMLSSSTSDFSEFRSIAQNLDFHLSPLSFREAVLLKGETDPTPEILYEEFNTYLQHGGFLQIINELKMSKAIQDKTLLSYAEWIVKEIEKQGKQGHFLREIFNAIVRHYNQPISWNTLTRELTINHPKTISDYLETLEDMGIVFIQYALLEKELKPAPKKARKVMFTDPFIYHAIRAWLSSGKQFYADQIKPISEHSELISNLVKTCVITQYYRYFPTFYVKDEGEVTLAYVQNQAYWPIEITWTERIRAKNLKQILKYSNGRILTKTERSGIIEHIMTEPLPSALWKLEKDKDG